MNTLGNVEGRGGGDLVLAVIDVCVLKWPNTQHSGQMSLLKQHCYCPMLLMRTTKTAVCLQTKAILHQLYGF